MYKLVVIVPSRGRPGNIMRLAEHFCDTRTFDYTDLVVAVDDDDPTKWEYELMEDNRVHYEYGERLRLGGTLNKLAVKYAEHADFIGFMGDDHLPRSQAWDLNLMAAIHDGKKPGVAYGNDLFQQQNLPTAVVMSSSIIKAIGYMCPPGLVHLYLDNFWLDLGKALNNLQYRHDVIIEHMHPQAGKADNDAGYVEVNSQQMFSEDAAKYKEYKDSGQFYRDVQKILDLKNV